MKPVLPLFSRVPITRSVLTAALVAIFGVTVIDAQPVPVNPVLVGGYNTPGYSRDLAVVGDLVYVCDGATGLMIFDVTDRAQPQLLGTWDATGGDVDLGFTSDVAVVGNLAFLADGLLGMQVINVANANAPSRTGTYPVAQYARGVSAVGSFAYLCESDLSGRDNFFHVFDVSNPASPSLQGSAGMPNYPTGSVIVGNIAYVSAAPGGVRIVDIANATAPAVIGSFATPTYARSVFVDGLLAYVATAEVGLYVLDVDVPATPTLEGSLDTPDYAFGVDKLGSYAYVADDENGVVMIDVSDPMLPAAVFTVDTPGKAISVHVDGNYAYVADGPGGLQIIRVDNSPTSVVIGAFSADYRSGAVELQWHIDHADGLTGFHLYRARGDDAFTRINTVALAPGAPHRYRDDDVGRGGVYRYQLGAVDRDGEFRSAVASVVVPGSRARLEQNHPNPFNPVTTIRYYLPESSDVSLQVFDAHGALVRTLAASSQPAGTRAVTWDGRDDAGHVVASGVYLYRLSTPHFQQTRKMTLVK